MNEALRRNAGEAWAFRTRVERDAAQRFARLAGVIAAFDSASPIPELLRKASADEQRHAALCAGLAEAYELPASGSGDESPIAPPALGPRAAALYEMVAACCITESESVATLTTLLAADPEPRVESVLREIARDEVAHGRMGWAHLAREASFSDVSFLGPSIPAMLSGTVDDRLFAALSEDLETADLLRHGVLPHSQKRAIFVGTLEEVVLPGLAKFCLELTTGSAWATARPFTPEKLLATRRADDVQVSPDGRWASVTVRQKNLQTNKDDKDIWLLPLPAGPARQFTRNARSEHTRWSPDGKQVLVVREGQLWRYALDGGDAQQITSLSGGADAGVYSPDGRWIAFTSEVYPQCGGNETCNKERAESGVHARIVDHLFARHWTEWKEGKRTHVFVMPSTGGAARDVTPLDSDWPSFRLGGGDDFRFTPDGELIVSSKPAQREAWSTNGDLWSIGRAGGAPKNLTPDNHGDDAQPRPSPDGRYLAWTSQARDGYESDQWTLKLQDRRTGRITVADIQSDDVGSFVWRRDGKGLVAAVVQKAHHWLYDVSLDGKFHKFSETPSGGDDFDVAPDGTAIVANAGLTHPPEVVALKPGGRPIRLSHFNDEQYKDLDLGTAEDLWVEAKDGSKLHSWVIRPANAPPKLPLLVLIHGGPQGSWEDAWTMRWNGAVFAARGYVVLQTDFHGSAGYGQKFKEQISGDWGGLAYDDVLRATDAAEKLPFVEAGHTCAAGASFGGYMVDWIAGHTDRFACLVSHDGVFDLASAYFSTEELWFPEWEFRGPPWQNQELYRRLSPSSYVESFKTPTLVVQGELDFRVPVEQGLGMFTALQRRGVESRLLYFPDEGHWVLKPKNSQLWYHTVLEWIDAHAKPGNKQAVRP